MKRVAEFLILGLVLLIAAWHARVYWPFLSDDALISLRYAERLLDGHGLTWTDGERVEGYTDLAWVLLTALLGAFRIDLVIGARVLGLLGAAAALVFTALRSDRPTSISIPRAATGSLMLALSAPLAVWSIGGLEHGFEAGVLVAAAWLLLRQRPEVPPPRAEKLALAVLLVLLAWLRADGAVLIGGLLLGNVLRLGSRAAFKASFIQGLVPLGALLLQLGFRRLYYSAWVPNTALVKVGFSSARVDLGLEHVRHWAMFATSILIAGGLALVFQIKRERRWAVPVTTSLVWVAYLIVMGGDIFPAWRQLLFGIVPLGLLIADGGEAAWDRTQFKRPWLRWVSRLVVLSGFTFLAVTYARDQGRDPQNRRGVDERWEFDGVSLGGFMRQAWSQQRPLLAVDAAGALPYYSQLPSLDLLGLNDRYIATHPPPGLVVSTGHELGDGAYVWSRKPDILSMCGAGGGRWACFLGGKQVLTNPAFGQFYQLMRYHSVVEKDLAGELWVRREEGPIAVQRSGDEITVPGWLLAQASGVAELHEGRLQALVTPISPAHLIALRVPAGKWRLSASDAAASLGVLCEGRSVPRGSGEGLVVELPVEAHLDVLVGSKSASFIDRLVLTRTSEPAQVRCDPSAAPGVLEVDAAQLDGSAPASAYFLQPHGLKLTRGDNARVRLGPLAAARYELSVDGNDLYRLRFLSPSGESLGDRTLPDHPAGGLVVQQVDVPAGAVLIEIAVSGGDGTASLGHLRPLP